MIKLNIMTYTKKELNKRHRRKKYLQRIARLCPENLRPLANLPYGWTQEMYNERLGRLIAARSAFGRGQGLENTAGYTLINSIIELIKHTNYTPRDKIRICFNMTAILINSAEIGSSRLKSWAELTTNYNFDKADVEELGQILHDQLTPENIKQLTDLLWQKIAQDKKLLEMFNNHFSFGTNENGDLTIDKNK